MVRFAPPSKPVTLVPFKGRCQIKSKLLQLNDQLPKISGKSELAKAVMP
jgi:hypothetical protein